MSKTKFNKMHKHTITVNSTKYKIKHLKLDPDSNYCTCCDCNESKDYIHEQSEKYLYHCDNTIGVHCVLKHIKHEQKRNI